MNKPSLSLIVPAYNEGENIHYAVETNRKTLQTAGIDFEIIIIDDGSQDHTRKIVEENFISLPGFKFYSKPNGGIGSAIKTGIALATKNYITFAPVDSPLTQEVLVAILSNLGKADILVAYRLARRGYSWRMKLNSSLYHFLISHLFGLRLKDYNWLHVYRKEVIDTIPIENGYIFMLAEVLIRAKRLGLSFYEFPVQMEARTKGSPTAASFKAALRTARDMFHFYFKNRR